MARAPKLKVFCTPIGFYDALVAAPSRKAALKAWGTTTDLFAAGRAGVVEDPAEQAEALAHPGEVIKRPRGGGDAGTLIAEMEAADAADRSAGKGKARRSLPSPVPRRPVPDRSRLDAAERMLADAERELGERLERFTRERADLDAREAAARRDGEARIGELRRERDGTDAAYREAVEGSGR